MAVVKISSLIRVSLRWLKWDTVRTMRENNWKQTFSAPSLITSKLRSVFVFVCARDMSASFTLLEVANFQHFVSSSSAARTYLSQRFPFFYTTTHMPMYGLAVYLKRRLIIHHCVSLSLTRGHRGSRQRFFWISFFFIKINVDSANQTT